MGRFLNLIGSDIRCSGTAKEAKKANEGVYRETRLRPTNKTDNSRLEGRLEQQGLRIAINHKTSEVCLVFSESDAEAARTVAQVYKPFERDWTESQRRSLLADLDYYESILRRKAAQE
jgi:hypothetical protein